MPLQSQRLQANVALLKGSATEAKDIKDNNMMAGIIMVDLSEFGLDSQQREKRGEMYKKLKGRGLELW